MEKSKPVKSIPGESQKNDKSLPLEKQVVATENKGGLARILPEEVEAAVEEVSAYTKLQEIGLQLKIERDSDQQVVVQLVDRSNDEIIKQIPTEEALELAKHLRKVFDDIERNRKEIAGSFLDDKA